MVDPHPSAPGVPDDVTLVEVLHGFLADGYDGEFAVEGDGLLCCRRCGTCVPPRAAAVDALRRLEGASDPADMAAVLAVRCAACATRGTVVVRFGPEAGRGDAELLTGLDRVESDVGGRDAPPGG